MISNTSSAGSGGSEFDSDVASLSFSSLFQGGAAPVGQDFGLSEGWWRLFHWMAAEQYLGG